MRCTSASPSVAIWTRLRAVRIAPEPKRERLGKAVEPMNHHDGLQQRRLDFRDGETMRVVGTARLDRDLQTVAALLTPG